MRARVANKISKRIMARALDVVDRDGRFIPMAEPGGNTGEVIAGYRTSTLLAHTRKLLSLVARASRNS